MAYDEHLADRIQRMLDSKKVKYEDKRMFGGIAFMVDDKMCVGVSKNRLMARVDPDAYEKLIAIKGAQPMDMTKRPMKGFVFVQPEGVDNEADLEFWIEQCLEYNPKAKSSKK